MLECFSWFFVNKPLKINSRLCLYSQWLMLVLSPVYAYTFIAHTFVLSYPHACTLTVSCLYSAFSQ